MTKLYIWASGAPEPESSFNFGLFQPATPEQIAEAAGAVELRQQLKEAQAIAVDTSARMFDEVFKAEVLEMKVTELRALLAEQAEDAAVGRGLKVCIESDYTITRVDDKEDWFIIKAHDGVLIITLGEGATIHEAMVASGLLPVEEVEPQPLATTERYRQVGEAAEALMFANGGLAAWHRWTDGLVGVTDANDKVLGTGVDLHQALMDATKEMREANGEH